MNEQSTTSLEHRLGNALGAMVAAEQPTAVTVTDLIESGRRRFRRRRRTRMTFAVSVAMVTAMAVTIGVVVGIGQGRETPVPANGGPTPSVTPTMGTHADLAAPIVAFGWLPSGSTGAYEVSQSATGANFLVPADPKTGWFAEDGPGVSMVEASGPGSEFIDASVQGPGSGTEPGLTFTTAGLVQGHQASWATGTPGSAQAARLGNLMLMWQYQPGAWAAVSMFNAATSVANGEMLLKVAQNLKIGPADPLAMPFHLPALPARLHTDAVDVDLPQQHGSHTGTVSVRLCAVSPCALTGGMVIAQSPTTSGHNPVFVVDNAPGGLPPGGTLSGGTAVTIGGYAATLWTNASGATVAFTYGTAKVTIEVAGREYQAIGGKDGFLAFCRTLTWLGADPAHWTTHVVG